MTPDAREQARHIIETVQAHMDGKQIQRTGRFEDEPWEDDPAPNWDWHLFAFRVKPEERKPREWTVWINEKGDIVTSNPLMIAFREGPFTQTRVVEVLPSEKTGKGES